MPSRPRPKIADYAAVGVGPVLIFLMISSLANFFLSLLYDGSFSDRLYYLILMYTMGAVALARIVIEESRAYSAGYAVGLGAAMIMVMTGLTGSLVFAVGIVLLIGYLADRIVHDCTVIDESVDSSGEGLIDRGMDEFWGLSDKAFQAESQSEAPESEKEQRRRKAHQPGRTVFLLALAALPLFGIGQFMLRDTPHVWMRAQQMLGLYLFSSLSLLVTTSFLNTRRYLRQRDVDMPADVSVAWLSGGIALIAALLCLAFLAPVPGRALAHLSLPAFLESDKQSASQTGWGNEAAERSQSESDARTDHDRNPDDKDQGGAGNNQNQRSGETGGEKPSEKSGGPNEGKSSQQQSGKSGPQNKDAEKTKQQDSGKQQQSKSESPPNSQDLEKDSRKQSQKAESNQDSEQSDQPQQPPNENSQPEQDSDQPEPDSAEENNQQSNQRQQQSEQTDQNEQSESSQSDQSQESSSSGSNFSGLISALGGLIRFLLILGLMVIVAYYVYQMRKQLLQWWRSLFARDSAPELDKKKSIAQLQAEPPRPFATYRNPIGRESDPRRVIIITAQAFDAWSRERGYPRRNDETPSEHTQRMRQQGRQRQELQQLFGPIDQSAKVVTLAYDRIVYGRGSANQSDIDAASQMWQHMSSVQPPASQPAAPASTDINSTTTPTTSV